MNLSALRRTSLVGRLLRWPLRLIPGGTVLPILQGRLKGRRWIVGSSSHGCWLGSYEHTQRTLFERTVRPGDVVYDIGAHAGFYTLLASLLVEPHGRVFAFEPCPANLAYLRRHLSLNRVANTTVIAAAVSDRGGQARFVPGANSSMGRLAAGGGFEVETVTLDELVAEQALPLPDCIKMDIEGAEAAALSGAKALLAQRHPTLFLATHGAAVRQECCRLLQALGYRLQPIDGFDPESSSELLATHDTR